MAPGQAPRPSVFVRFGQRLRSLLTHPALRQRLRQGAISLLLLLTLLCGPNGLLTNVSMSFAQTQASSPGKPNRFDPTQDATSVTHSSSSGKSDPNWKAGKPQPLTHPQLPMMAPGTLVLHNGQAATFLGSDGHLEVDVPASALTASDLTQAGGSESLQITQIAPASGSSAGGWGVVSFGTYLLQVVDAQGRAAPRGLRAPVTLTYHYGARERAFDLPHTFVVLNGGLPQGVHLATPAGTAQPTLGTRTTQSATLDSTHQTLTVTPLLGSPSTSLTWDTYAPVATFGKPDPFNVDLNAGALTANYPLDLPAGPGGLTPPLMLSYSSAGVSEQHSPQGAAGWVGEGWNLSLGSISWAEHNATAGSGTNTWEDSWQLNDPYGTSAELIPPNITVSTFTDDSGHSITPSPITWHTAPETHIKIISYTGPISLGGTAAPCFRVFLQNGIMEEFGCTADSLQYYVQPNGSGVKYYIANWFLDLITDRNGNQIHVTYQSDFETGAGGVTYPRDTELAAIEWDSPTCQNAQAACTGNAWAPLLRVTIAANHVVEHPTNTPSGCNTAGSTRCDDPQDLSGSGGLAAPQIETTNVLNDLLFHALAPLARGTACGTISLATSKVDRVPSLIPQPASSNR
jgi:hypothetical protein